DGLSFLYDLSQPVTTLQNTAVTLSQQGTFGWGALTGDGSYMLTNMVNPSSTNPAIGQPQSGFWNFIPTQPPSGTSPSTMPAQGTLTGLPSGVKAGYPSYSPDDKYVAYTDVTNSPSNLAGEPIAVASYDATTLAFSNVQTVLQTSGVMTS